MVPQAFYTFKHKFFPSFEPKRYHLQCRHGALLFTVLLCASVLLPAFPQLHKFDDSPDYSDSDVLPTRSSYDRIHRYIKGIVSFNEFVAVWIVICVCAEGLLQRSSPVWYEFTWMSLVLIGEVICLALMVSSRPAACDYNLTFEEYVTEDMKFPPGNSLISMCSNWRGMSGMLAAIIFLFMLHLGWHTIIAFRHKSSRPGYFTTPMPEYRWTLPRALERLEPQLPPTDIEKADAKEKQLETSSLEYTSRGTESLSFPMTPTSEEYSNFSRLPVTQKPVVLVQSSVTRSDTSSVVEDVSSSPKAPAPFSYESK